MLLRKQMRHAQITPTAASMKLQRLVGADSKVGSFVARVNGRVAMRSAVVRQMKKPMEKRIRRLIRELVDMFSLKMTGIGSRNIARSVMRLVTALDQLPRTSATSLICQARETCRCHRKLMHVPGMLRLYTRGTGVHWKMHTKRYEIVQPAEIAPSTKHACRKRRTGKMR
jgi:hypothetical protein